MTLEYVITLPIISFVGLFCTNTFKSEWFHIRLIIMDLILAKATVKITLGFSL